MYKPLIGYKYSDGLTYYYKHQQPTVDLSNCVLINQYRPILQTQQLRKIKTTDFYT